MEVHQEFLWQNKSFSEFKVLFGYLSKAVKNVITLWWNIGRLVALKTPLWSKPWCHVWKSELVYRLCGVEILLTLLLVKERVWKSIAITSREFGAKCVEIIATGWNIGKSVIRKHYCGASMMKMCMFIVWYPQLRLLVLEFSLIRSHLVWGEFSAFSAANAIHNSLIFFPPGTHHCWLGRGSMEWEVCLTLLHMTSSGNWTPDLLMCENQWPYRDAVKLSDN